MLLGVYTPAQDTITPPTVETYGPKITGLQAIYGTSKQGAGSVFQLTKSGGTGGECRRSNVSLILRELI